jgi:hypothetical protein
LKLKYLVRQLESARKKREKRGPLICRSPQKYEGHSQIAPANKKEWHSSFAPNLGSKKCRSCTHCQVGWLG